MEWCIGGGFGIYKCSARNFLMMWEYRYCFYSVISSSSKGAAAQVPVKKKQRLVKKSRIYALCVCPSIASQPIAKKRTRRNSTKLWEPRKNSRNGSSAPPYTAKKGRYDHKNIMWGKATSSSSTYRDPSWCWEMESHIKKKFCIIIFLERKLEIWEIWFEQDVVSNKRGVAKEICFMGMGSSKSKVCSTPMAQFGGSEWDDSSLVFLI